MAKLNFDEQYHTVGLASTADSGGASVTSDIVNLGKYHSADFLIYFGTITGDTIAVTLEECDDVTPSNSTAIAFTTTDYRAPQARVMHTRPRPQPSPPA